MKVVAFCNHLWHTCFCQGICADFREADTAGDPLFLTAKRGRSFVKGLLRKLGKAQAVMGEGDDT